MLCGTSTLTRSDCSDSPVISVHVLSVGVWFVDLICSLMSVPAAPEPDTSVACATAKSESAATLSVPEPVTRFHVGKREAGRRLDHFLHQRIPGLSRSRIQQAIRERVTLSWEVEPRPSTPVRAGGEVRIGYTPLQEELLDLRLPILARGDGIGFKDHTGCLSYHRSEF